MTAVDWESTLADRLVRLGLPPPTRQFSFALDHRYRFDLCWPTCLLAVEVDGGTWGKGPACPCCGNRQPLGHNTGAGIARNHRKHNLATYAGWRVFYVIPDWIEDGSALVLIAGAFGDETALARARLAARMLGRTNLSAQIRNRRPDRRRVPVIA